MFDLSNNPLAVIFSIGLAAILIVSALLTKPTRSAEYVQIRLDIARRSTTLAELTPAVDRSNALQEALWQQAKAMASKDKGAVPTGLFISRSMR